jgi:hypothetical protein
VDAEVWLAEARAEFRDRAPVGGDLVDASGPGGFRGDLLTSFGGVESAMGFGGEVHGVFAGFGRLRDLGAEAAPCGAGTVRAWFEGDDAVAGEGEEPAVGEGEALGFVEAGGEAVPCDRAGRGGKSAGDPDIAIDGAEGGAAVGQAGEAAEADPALPWVGEGEGRSAVIIYIYPPLQKILITGSLVLLQSL